MAYLNSESHCYVFTEIMGKGSFGEVWKAWKKSTGERVAIKIIRNDKHKNSATKNELKLLQTIKQLDPEKDHIIQFMNYFHDGDNFYLVFELLHLSLYQYQKINGFTPVPARHIRTITCQVLEALAKLKEISVIHTDLKPENIMLVNHEKYPFKVKVIDFGSANILSEVKDVSNPYMQSRYYRSPEILLALPFDEKVDMWSLGCIMAELHLGCPLYPGNNEYDQIRLICNTQGLPPSHMLDATPKSFYYFVRMVNLQGQIQWRLKTMQECGLDNMEKPAMVRKYLLKSLDQLKTLHAPKYVPLNPEIQAEYYDLMVMVELIKEMLAWDCRERIDVNAAMKHPFISLQHLKMYFGNRTYFQQSHDCSYNALRNNNGGVLSSNTHPGQEVKHLYVTAEVPSHNYQLKSLDSQKPGKEVTTNMLTYHPMSANQISYPTVQMAMCQTTLHHYKPRKEPTAAQSKNYNSQYPKTDECFLSQMPPRRQIPEDHTGQRLVDNGTTNTSILSTRTSITDDNVNKRVNTSLIPMKAQTETCGIEKLDAPETGGGWSHHGRQYDTAYQATGGMEHYGPTLYQAPSIYGMWSYW